MDTVISLEEYEHLQRAMMVHIDANPQRELQTTLLELTQASVRYTIALSNESVIGLADVLQQAAAIHGIDLIKELQARHDDRLKSAN